MRLLLLSIVLALGCGPSPARLEATRALADGHDVFGPKICRERACGDWAQRRDRDSDYYANLAACYPKCRTFPDCSQDVLTVSVEEDNVVTLTDVGERPANEPTPEPTPDCTDAPDGANMVFENSWGWLSNSGGYPDGECRSKVWHTFTEAELQAQRDAEWEAEMKAANYHDAKAKRIHQLGTTIISDDEIAEMETRYLKPYRGSGLYQIPPDEDFRALEEFHELIRQQMKLRKIQSASPAELICTESEK